MNGHAHWARNWGARGEQPETSGAAKKPARTRKGRERFIFRSSKRTHCRAAHPTTARPDLPSLPRAPLTAAAGYSGHPRTSCGSSATPARSRLRWQQWQSLQHLSTPRAAATACHARAGARRRSPGPPGHRCRCVVRASEPDGGSCERPSARSSRPRPAPLTRSRPPNRRPATCAGRRRCPTCPLACRRSSARSRWCAIALACSTGLPARRVQQAAVHAI